jgi:putative hydrolase of the HAD superfamily
MNVNGRRAVIFDLWETLVDWPKDGWNEHKRDFAARLGLSLERFEVLWMETYPLRETGRLAESFRALGADDATAAEFSERRRVVIGRALVPRPGALETLDELRRRGVRLGLISVCSDEVPELWPQTPFAGRFDAEVFSCVCGLMKPDPRIYLLASEQLGVEPESCFFVGDGANDELQGAARVGMRPVLIHRPGEAPFWDGLEDWEGLRITSIPEVLDLT